MSVRPGSANHDPAFTIIAVLIVIAIVATLVLGWLRPCDAPTAAVGARAFKHEPLPVPSAPLVKSSAQRRVAASDDVFVRLMTFPNVLITAHQAFFTREALASIMETTMGTSRHSSGAPQRRPTRSR